MKRFLLIGFLAVVLPMGLGATEIEKYDGTQDAETWFFDNILDENGELILKDYQTYSKFSFWEARAPILETHFGCIPAPGQFNRWGKEVFVDLHILELSTRPPTKFTLHDNRYLVFGACKHGVCGNQSEYIFDIKDREIAVATIYQADIFDREKDAEGRTIHNSENPYTKLFISAKATEEFIAVSKKFTKTFQQDWIARHNNSAYAEDKIQSIKEFEIIKADCYKEN